MQSVNLIFSGQLNRYIGWVLLISAFGCAIWLDPLLLSERTSSESVGNSGAAALQIQTIVIVMAFLQLVTAELVMVPSLPPLARRFSSLLTGLGMGIFAAGYALSGRWASAPWLVALGALMSLTGFVSILWGNFRWRESLGLRIVLPMICAGMILGVVMSLFEIYPEQYLPSYVGPEDGLRLRMLRMARVAVFVLSVLILLFELSTAQADPYSRAVRWGRTAMICGTIGIPIILTAAGLTLIELKVLLPIPANAMFAGTLCAVWLSRRYARPLEFWGWSLIALGMGAGLLMGLYAFDGPLPSSKFFGAYHDLPRRLIRLSHIYCVVLGLVTIFVSRELNKTQHFNWPQWMGERLLILGSLTTVGVILLLTGFDLPPEMLAVGPALVTTGIVLCVGPIAAITQGQRAWSLRTNSS